MKIKLFFVLLCILVLGGCINNGTKGNANLEKEIYKGTSGVVLDIYDSLADVVYEGETLNYVVKIVNNGPYPVDNAKILVSLEKGYMFFLDNNNVNVISGINLEGKSVFNTFDDFEVKEKTIKVNKIDDLSEYHDSVILTSFCYEYQGVAIADVCIDTDPYETQIADKACSIKDTISLSEGQGGPVVISSIETKMLLDNNKVKPQFKIRIINQGQGTVIKPGSINSACNKDALEDSVYNTITLVNIKLSNYNLKDFECFPKDLVLRQEEDTITCTLRDGISKDIASYQTPLRIEIAYAYMESLSKEIKIKKILKY